MRLIKKIPYFFIFWLLISCQSDGKKETCGSAWIGGEIVNPKLDYVIISHNRNTIDTVALDDKNFFRYKLEQVDPGIYFFSHFEYQALHIEPGDSIMFRVNTIEFDESLTYSGKGSEKNNFLMDIFLENEAVMDVLPTMYAFSPNEFESKMDSVKTAWGNQYTDFKSRNEVSAGFEEVAEAAMNYNIFAKKELYISAMAKKQRYDDSMKIPESFFNFREDIDLGNETLRNYYPYFRCLEYYMDNLAYEAYKSEASFDRRSYRHNHKKIEVIDSLITNDSLRNNLLRLSMVRYLLNGDNAEEEMQMLNTFTHLNNNPSDVMDITRLTKATMRLTPGNEIPNVILVSNENTLKDLHSVVNRPTVFYFWSSQSIKQYRNIHTRASELRAKYPEFDFIGVNVDDHFKKWRRIINSSGYNTQYEYQFDDFDDAEMKLLVNTANKSIIVDAKGVILNGNSQIYGLEIEQELLGYINR